MKLFRKLALTVCAVSLLTLTAQPVAQAGFNIGGILNKLPGVSTEKGTAGSQGKSGNRYEAATYKEPQMVKKDSMGYSASGPGRLFGHVYYEGGKPGANVKLLLTSENVDIDGNICRNDAYYVTTTNGNGDFSIPVKTGLYGIVAWSGTWIGTVNHYSADDTAADCKLTDRKKEIVFEH